MTTTQLGDGLTTAPLGYGAMGLAEVYGAIDEADGLATLHHVVDAGIDLVDTADVYGNGTNERLVARLLADRRDEVTLATKFGIVPEDDTHTRMTTRNDPEYVRQACDASLERLGTDVIDLYYLHRRQVSVPVEEVVGAMAGLVTAGKVRHLGLSEVTAAELRAACAVHPIAAVQSEWSLWSRDVERQVVPAAVELGVGFVPYSPLGRGFLTGSIGADTDLSSDWRGGLTRFSGAARRRQPGAGRGAARHRRRARRDAGAGGAGVAAPPRRRARPARRPDPGHPASRPRRREPRLPRPDARRRGAGRARRARRRGRRATVRPGRPRLGVGHAGVARAS